MIAGIVFAFTYIVGAAARKRAVDALPRSGSTHVAISRGRQELAGPLLNPSIRLRR